MNMINLTEAERHDIEQRLDLFDQKRIGKNVSDKRISIGIKKENELIAGLDASITAFNILYLSTLFVDSAHRRQGLGKQLITEMESQAKALNVNTIRLDTFDWQGRDFYIALSYEIVGHYRNDEEDYEEFFFIKRI